MKKKWLNILFTKQKIFLLILPGYLCAKEAFISYNDIANNAPIGWEISKQVGDLNGDGIDDIVVNSYNLTERKQNMVVLLQRDPGKYESVFKSYKVLSFPDPSNNIHSIFAQIRNNRLLVIANSSGAAVSESFTFNFKARRFILTKYELTEIKGCNNYTPTYYGWTEHFARPIYMEEFSVQSFYDNYRNSLDLRKDVDPILKSQYDNLSKVYKERNKKLLQETVKNILIAFDDDGVNKCDPDEYLDRYLYLNDSTKTIISNDIAYYFEQAGYYDEAIYLLKKITARYPKRTVAYLNLGDSYWGKEMKLEAKRAYQLYISQMKEIGNENRIPSRVQERLAQ